MFKKTRTPEMTIRTRTRDSKIQDDPGRRRPEESCVGHKCHACRAFVSRISSVEFRQNCVTSAGKLSFTNPFTNRYRVDYTLNLLSLKSENVDILLACHSIFQRSQTNK